MIDEEKRNDLILYRIEQSKESIEEAELLIVNLKYRAAINRIYYGMFYSVLALGLKYQFETSKHQQLLGWFNRDFIHTGKIDIKYGEMIKNAFRSRNKSDYETDVVFSNEDVETMFMNMKEFIINMEKFLFDSK